MKNASSATLAILSSGNSLLAELYTLTLSTGQGFRFTSFQVPLTAAIYPSVTNFTYLTGLVIQRGPITQKTGVEAGSMTLTLSPQGDSASGAVLVGGYPLLAAARYGFLDGALLQFSKLFMSYPAPGTVIDTSPGAVSWFIGKVQGIEVDRMSVVLTCDDFLADLAQQQMPRMLYQTACFHQVYDAGCKLTRSAFTVIGTVVTAGDGAHFTSNLTQVSNYFNLGTVTFTSGVNAGQSGDVALFAHTGGAFTMRMPFAKTPTVGDQFTVYPGCDLQLATCANTNPAVGAPFNNLAHFSWQPFIPVPETMLDGGTNNPATPPQGKQSHIIGSGPTGRDVKGGYTP